jgi:hypothetical protein
MPPSDSALPCDFDELVKIKRSASVLGSLIVVQGATCPPSSYAKDDLLVRLHKEYPHLSFATTQRFVNQGGTGDCGNGYWEQTLVVRKGGSPSPDQMGR